MASGDTRVLGMARGRCGRYCFFSSRRRHTRYWRDWSSDVCSSDLDYGDKISDEDRSSVESALSNLKEKLAGDDTVAITSATEALQQASYKLAEAVYAQAQSGPGQAQAGTTTATDQGTTQGDGDVVDAEIIDEGDQDQQKGA